jgi:hypothetical protein
VKASDKAEIPKSEKKRLAVAALTIGTTKTVAAYFFLTRPQVSALRRGG